jgi:hypothetical protein
MEAICFFETNKNHQTTPRHIQGEVLITGIMNPYGQLGLNPTFFSDIEKSIASLLV